MSARDEILRTILGTRHMHALHLQVPADIVEHVGNGIADAILAAGYSRPRTITTADELDALSAGSVVRSDEGTVWESDSGVWFETASRLLHVASDIALPATVLHEPKSA